MLVCTVHLGKTVKTITPYICTVKWCVFERRQQCYVSKATEVVFISGANLFREQVHKHTNEQLLFDSFGAKSGNIETEISDIFKGHHALTLQCRPQTSPNKSVYDCLGPTMILAQ